jgi:proline iminopeptidase
MLHGHPGNGLAMTVFAAAVHPLWAIAPDLRGYGRSRANTSFAIADHLEDLDALLNTLGIDRCLVLGWSLGGILALELALRHPERIVGLVLVASAARPWGKHPPIEWTDNLMTGVASLLNVLLPAWQWNIDTFGRRSLYRYLIRQHSPTAYGYLAEYAVPAYLQTSSYAHQALQIALRDRYNRLDALPSLTQPTLVLAGSHDCHIACEASAETARVLPQATWIEYPNTAHLFPWECPEQVRGDIRQWFQQQGWIAPHSDRTPS